MSVWRPGLSSHETGKYADCLLYPPNVFGDCTVVYWPTEVMIESALLAHPMMMMAKHPRSVNYPSSLMLVVVLDLNVN